MLSLIIFLDMLETEEQKSTFEKLYQNYKNLMYHVSYQILLDESLAEDAAHQAFLKAIDFYTRIGYPDSNRTKNWMITIVKNIALNEKKRRKKLIHLEQLDYEPSSPDAVDIESVIDENDLKELLKLFPEIYRDILHFVITYGLDYKTISKQLGISESTARKRFERAKNMMKEILREKGEFTDEFYIK